MINRLPHLALAGTAIFAALVANSTHDAPMGGWMNNDPAAVMDIRPDATPAWDASYEARFPGCSAKVEGIPSAFVAMDLFGEVKVITWDEADAAAASPEEHDDLWIVGQCA
jgi:hypothetical protein